jgi:amino acid transporter/mannitol/fructose-specific phosphotransferase system IIA component (Ntr-type)
MSAKINFFLKNPVSVIIRITMRQKPHFLQRLIREIISLKVVSTRLRKDLGLLEVFCISSGAMISSGLFILVAIAFTQTGPSVIASYLIASLLIIPTILAKAELSTAMPKTGGIFVFTDRSMGPIMGTLAGLSAWFSLAFKTAFALLGMGIFISLLNPDITLWQQKLFAVACCLFFMVVNLYGVKLTGRMQSFMVLVLLGILSLYVGRGIFSVELSRFSPFAPMGLRAVLATAGMVFIAFAGTTKIAAVAGEVKNPGRNLPIGIFLSWAVVSLLYLAVIFVTVGVESPSELSGSLTPLSVGGRAIMGQFGLIIMSIAAILAFITTGNAGILAASRDPMAMGKAGLLPGIFERVSRRGTPWASIIITSIFMIMAILFLDLEIFVKTASTLKLILFSLANLALIFIRWSNLKHYNPTFRAPLCPWLQIIAIIAYGTLIVDMGRIPLILTAIFFIVGLAWYFLYAHRRVSEEYSLLKLIKKTADIAYASRLEDEELREILIEKDELVEQRFENMLKNCLILDVKHPVQLNDVFKMVSEKLAHRMKVGAGSLYGKLIKREKRNHIIGKQGYSIIFSPINGEGKFKIAMVRTRKRVDYSDKYPPAHAFFIIVSTKDIKAFQLRSLMWLAQIAEKEEFNEKWLAAKDADGLRNVVLSLWKKAAKAR